MCLANERVKRSGGFPKFPLEYFEDLRTTEPLMCGSRSVEHRPILPNYKIVGGSVPPYGAYPWQVSFNQKKFKRIFV